MSDTTDYTVGWICALKSEFVAAQEVLDEEHDPPDFVSTNDHNSYKVGRIAQHNVVIAVLPDGEYGTSSASAVARDMLHTFPNIRIGLMVGIGGGAPSSKRDIRLGDVVVSSPRNGNSGVFQYDFGKTIQERTFQHTKHLDQPPTFVRTAVASLQADHERKGHDILQVVETITNRNRRLRKYRRPDLATDVLYHSDFLHSAAPGDCAAASCASSPERTIKRRQRDQDEGDDDPTVHYGLVASANQLMKDATVRDRLAAEKDVLCFEMEAAGLMDHFPCLVIRGICDYSDTHKNDVWHGYAAMTAAAYTADLLRRIPQNRVEAEKKISYATHQLLSSTIIDDLVTTASSSLAYFYFEFSDTTKRTLDNLLRSLIYQFHGRNGQSDLPIQDLWRSCASTKKWNQPTNGQLYDCLVDVLKVNIDSWLVMDALDESTTKEGSHVEGIFRFLEQLREDAKGKCHILVTSRNNPDIGAGLQWSSFEDRMSLQEARQQQDIESYVEYELRPGGRFDRWQSRPSILKEMKDTIVSQSDHMFRWAACQLDSLAKCLSPVSLQKALHSLPQGLDKTYERMIQDISDENKDQAITILQLLVFSDRPLTVDELVDALAVDLTASPSFDPKLRMPRDIEICLFCPGLIVTKPRLGKLQSDTGSSLSELAVYGEWRFFDVRLAHYSVKEYLISTRLTGDIRILMSPSVARSTITAICLGYLSWFEQDTYTSLIEPREAYLASDHRRGNWLGSRFWISAEDTVPELERSFLFLNYSAQEWFKHASWTMENTPVANMIVEFLFLHQAPYQLWNRFFRRVRSILSPIPAFGRPLERPSGFFEDQEPAPALYHASHHGLIPIVSAVIQRYNDLNHAAWKQGYALVAAVAEGHHEVVSILLQAGADVHTTTPHGQSTFHIASFTGNEVVMRLLLGALEDETRLKLAKHECLRAACEGGQLSLVGSLLDEGVDIDMCSQHSPLEAACYNGNLPIIHLLMSHGADIEGLGLDRNPPLVTAASLGRTEIVSLLLTEGATLPKLPYDPGELPYFLSGEFVQTDLLDPALKIACKHLSNTLQPCLYYKCLGLKHNHKGWTSDALRLAVDPLDRGVARFVDQLPLDLPYMGCAAPNTLGVTVDSKNRGAARLILEQLHRVDPYLSSAELEIAITEGNLDFAYKLLNKGVGSNGLYHYADRQYDALGAACVGGHLEIVRILIKRGAAANTWFIKGDNVLDLAVLNGHTDIARLLLELSANASRNDSLDDGDASDLATFGSYVHSSC
ncbi:Ankyrin repeat and KH domain-containing protein 1 [Colletotrichum sidae]|uniref:Ankyrin repeat and KH domain-containing protein 1 n=1 Tax=Colletotrichum sidae TaxID=1347389 RepID=A0A4R8TNT1_9PEZI|nr:Ankyrin repeat and KH domain-containing protein 1 [Colletotrichum sidae]